MFMDRVANGYREWGRGGERKRGRGKGGERERERERIKGAKFDK
jgi:hypothetical protein